jgi:hypothetical protein
VYTLLRASGIRSALTAELPGFLVAFIVAQLFYKFGSFGLELVAFMCTWWLATFVKELLLRGLGRAPHR